MFFSSTVLTSDLLLAPLFPLVILYLGSKLFPPFTWSDIRQLIVHHKKTQRGPFSLQRAYYSYSQYSRLANDELSRMRSSYSTLKRAYKRLGFDIGYPRKLDRLKAVIDTNSIVAHGIVDVAREEFSVGEAYTGDCASSDLGRVREAVKHFVRDWSVEGKYEREKIFTPILSILKEVDVDERADKKVLVPGCGLGRLAWEISQLGYDTSANELSYFMILAFKFLLSPLTTRPEQHTIHPFAHWFSHQRTNDSLFRSIHFPDVVPRLTPSLRLIEGDFLLLTPPPPDGAGEASGYDYVVTLFFIDTSLNVLKTIEHIYDLLRPGGSWINLGPLLWSSNAEAKIELNLEEVLDVARKIGFSIGETMDSEDSHKHRRRQTIECEYTGDCGSSMRWIYEAEFWVGRKSN